MMILLLRRAARLAARVPGTEQAPRSRHLTRKISKKTGHRTGGAVSVPDELPGELGDQPRLSAGAQQPGRLIDAEQRVAVAEAKRAGMRGQPRVGHRQRELHPEHLLELRPASEAP